MRSAPRDPPTPDLTPAGVILDVDGTLVDSNDAHAHAWTEAFTEAGHRVTFERVRRLIGMGVSSPLGRAA